MVIKVAFRQILGTCRSDTYAIVEETSQPFDSTGPTFHDELRRNVIRALGLSALQLVDSKAKGEFFS